MCKRTETYDPGNPDIGNVGAICISMDTITYRLIPVEEIAIIRPLWEELNAEALARSRHFREFYGMRTFSGRQAALVAKAAAGEMRIGIAESGDPAETIGYCIATVSSDNTGEIDSILVRKDHRGIGIGSQLLADAIGWLETLHGYPVIVSVSEGNTEAENFYKKFGFARRMVVLQKV